MDILNFNTRLGKKAASKLLSMFLSKKLGTKVTVNLDKLHIKNDGTTVSIVFSGEASTPTDSIKL